MPLKLLSKQGLKMVALPVHFPFFLPFFLAGVGGGGCTKAALHSKEFVYVLFLSSPTPPFPFMRNNIWP